LLWTRQKQFKIHKMKTIKSIAIGAMLVLAFACNKDKIGLKPSGVTDQTKYDNTEKIVIIKPDVRNDMPPLYHDPARIAKPHVRNDQPPLYHDPAKVVKPEVRNDMPPLYHDPF